MTYIKTGQSSRLLTLGLNVIAENKCSKFQVDDLATIAFQGRNLIKWICWGGDRQCGLSSRRETRLAVRLAQLQVGTSYFPSQPISQRLANLQR